jgi:hypothetical protein
MSSKPRKGRIDTSTGRNKRDKVTQREVTVLRPERQIGTGQIVRGGRLAFVRARATRRGR